MANKRTVDPVLIPVTLADAKSHLRVDITDDDALITDMISEAVEVAEQVTGRAIMPQTWEQTLDAFPDAFTITRVPLASVTSITYVDANGATQTLPETDYSVDTSDGTGPAYIVPAYGTAWPETRDQVNAVTVTYVAGYANAAAVPLSIKRWVKIHVSTAYDNRNATETSRDAASVAIPFVDHLLDRFKVWTL